MGLDFVFTSPKGSISCYAFPFESDGTNNVTKYEALLLGLTLPKNFGIKVLNIIGDYDQIILQVKGQFACKNERLKRYKNAVWDAMEWFDSLSLETINIMFNEKANALAISSSTLQRCEDFMEK